MNGNEPTPKAIREAAAAWKAANPPGDQRQEGDDPTFHRPVQLLHSIASPPPEAAAAVGDILWRIDNEAEQFLDENGMIYLRWLRERIAALASPTGPQPAGGGVDEMAEAARMIVVGAIPATTSGHTCFVPRYQIEKLKNALAAIKGDSHAG